MKKALIDYEQQKRKKEELQRQKEQEKVDKEKFMLLRMKQLEIDDKQATRLNAEKEIIKGSMGIDSLLGPMEPVSTKQPGHQRNLSLTDKLFDKLTLLTSSTPSSSSLLSSSPSTFLGISKAALDEEIPPDAPTVTVVQPALCPIFVRRYHFVLIIGVLIMMMMFSAKGWSSIDSERIKFQTRHSSFHW